MQFLDKPGMIYIQSGFCRGLAILAMSALPLLGQSNFVSPNAPVLPNTPSVASPISESAPDADQPVTTITKRVDEVTVLFTATDKHGKFVRDLSEDDFAIRDDHKPPQSVVNFGSQTNLPLELGLLIDTSGSVHARFDFEQEAAVSFLQHTLRATYDKAFVMGFSTQSQVTQGFTDNIALLASGVHHLKDGGGTALYDAIYRACHDTLIKVEDERPVRRAIILVSDGEDNQSDVSRAQAIEMAQRAQVIIYAISTDDSGLILRGDTVLQQLADATGGRAFFPFKMKDIKNSFAAIEDELRSQYVVSYHPADFDPDGRFRPIEITSLKKDVQVRARRGYYAPNNKISTVMTVAPLR
jgi:Ca-activated chloride channel family protein